VHNQNNIFLQLHLLEPDAPAASAPGSAPPCPGDCARQCVGGLPVDCAASHHRRGQATAQPGLRSSGFGRILAELQHAARAAKLDRLKICAAEECRWLFYDRSKPGTRRWCASTLCGNRKNSRLPTPATAEDNIRGRLRFVEKRLCGDTRRVPLEAIAN